MAGRYSNARVSDAVGPGALKNPRRGAVPIERRKARDDPKARPRSPATPGELPRYGQRAADYRVPIHIPPGLMEGSTWIRADGTKHNLEQTGELLDFGLVS